MTLTRCETPYTWLAGTGRVQSWSEQLLLCMHRRLHNAGWWSPADSESPQAFETALPQQCCSSSNKSWLRVQNCIGRCRQSTYDILSGMQCGSFHCGWSHGLMRYLLHDISCRAGMRVRSVCAASVAESRQVGATESMF